MTQPKYAQTKLPGGPQRIIDICEDLRVRNKDGSYAVTEILIVGVATPYGFLPIEPSVVYTLLKVAEEKA